MFEFFKLCNEYEKLSALQRGAILTEKSVKILARMRLTGADENIDPVETLACFILASIAADGKVNEQEYILMYPALVKVFGSDFDFASVKKIVAENSRAEKIGGGLFENSRQTALENRRRIYRRRDRLVPVRGFRGRQDFFPRTQLY